MRKNAKIGGPESWHTAEELAGMLGKMETASGVFYKQAVQIGNHAFIEFAGLMNEYIKICQTTLDFAKEDFTRANTHSGIPLTAAPHQIAYMAEKFDCIFGPLLQDRKTREMFFVAMGWSDQDAVEEMQQAGLNESPVAP